MSEQESLIKKIKGLIDKANSTDSVHEAEAFMLKAQELLQKHNLEFHDVASYEEKARGIVDNETFYSDDFEYKLLNVIAHCNFCKAIRTPWEKKMNVIGRANNVSIVFYMFDFFRSALMRLSIPSYDNATKEKRKALLNADINPDKDKTMKKFKENYIFDYYVGGVDGISAKLMEQKKTARNDAKMNEVMILNDHEVGECVAKHYPSLRSSFSGKNEGKRGNGEGYSNGYRDGQSINQTTGVSGSNTKYIG